MALEIIQEPRKYAFLGNEIYFIAQDDVAEHKRFEYSITILGEGGGGQSQFFEARRDENNQAEVTGLGLILSAFFFDESYPLPSLNASELLLFANNLNICRQYTLYVRSVWGNEESFTITSTNRFALMGGVSEEDFLDKDFPEEDIVALTPTNSRTVVVEQPEFLYLLNKLANAYGLSLHVVVLHEDETKTTHDVPIATLPLFEGSVFGVDVSYQNLVAPLVTGKVLAYEVQVRAQTNEGEISSETQNYRVEYVAPNQSYFFVFKNSRGGISTLRATGERTVTLKVERQTANRKTSPTAPLGVSKKFVSSLSSGKAMKFNTGYSEDWEVNWQDFALSKTVWLCADGRLVPVQVATESITIFDDDLTKLPNMDFTVEYLRTSNFV